MTLWERYLDYLRISVFSNQSYVKYKFTPERNALDWVESNMKARHPGNYTVVEFYDSAKQRYDYRLNFANSNEELMWKIKYS